MTPDSRRVTSNLLGLVGALVGGTAGYYTFHWILDHGFYGLMIPGAMLGLGCGALSRHPSQTRGVLCGIAGLILGLFAEWTYSWFKADSSFAYMIAHLHEKETLTLIMLGLGAFFAYWLGKDAVLGAAASGGTQAVSAERREKPAE
ncbi:hypothetical protein OJF2_50250 [Aquisphaera giovannonii]|uniref:Uncharacterized protein n=1 Tax=Aquisphaera giovannonii TaxID=406548 RepID=A0A5B9W8W7_9BACT|nr:hypothetical protein [Aquisphaera giovannonii]QEH36461.1 hypothetical protein OJF2_50250 [Aquisphaera giovannonii]